MIYLYRFARIDDIQDNTLVRRGQPSAHCVYGLPATINASFHAIFLALKELRDLHPKVHSIFPGDLMGVSRNLLSLVYVMKGTENLGYVMMS